MANNRGNRTAWQSPSWRSQTAILLYHHIADAPHDPWNMCVTPQHFEEHLDVLRKFRFVTLQDAAPAQFRPFHTDRSIALTFDDGYADHLHTVLPLLERFDAPATFFVTTGQIGRTQPFWWDELALLFGGLAPDQAVIGSTPRQFYEAMRDSGEPERARQMAGLRFALRASPGGRELRSMTSEELYKLSRRELVEIGAHTINHPVLPLLSGPLQREEIGGSKQYLERLTGKRVMSFAYPFAGAAAITPETEEFVIDAGFGLACTTEPALLKRKHLCYRLPRFDVPDMDGDAFEAWLRRSIA